MLEPTFEEVFRFSLPVGGGGRLFVDVRGTYEPTEDGTDQPEELREQQVVNAIHIRLGSLTYGLASLLIMMLCSFCRSVQELSLGSASIELADLFRGNAWEGQDLRKTWVLNGTGQVTLSLKVIGLGTARVGEARSARCIPRTHARRKIAPVMYM